MIKGWIVFLMVILAGNVISQTNEKYPELEAKPIGGKEEVEQVMQTQLTLNKAILTSNFDEEITAFFDLDTNGRAINIKFAKGLNNVLRNELVRMYRFLKFEKTQRLHGDIISTGTQLNFQPTSITSSINKKVNINLK